MYKSILVTGASAGLGKECAKQLANIRSVEKVYLGARNPNKTLEVKRELEQATGRKIFEIVLMDMTNLDSVRSAVASLDEPIEALVMNAGGAGGPNFNDKTKDGVTQIFAQNLLGHVVLANEMIKAEKLTKAAIYSGSEAARGVKEMGVKRPELASSSVEEFASIVDGSFFGNVADPMVPYGYVKYMAALWMSAMAREHSEIRFVTISPGATVGTEGAETMPFFKKIFMKFMMNMMFLFGKTHSVETGAKRYVDALAKETFTSGVFYASKKGMAGEIGEQRKLFADLDNSTFQDNANQAILGFIK